MTMRLFGVLMMDGKMHKPAKHWRPASQEQVQGGCQLLLGAEEVKILPTLKAIS